MTDENVSIPNGKGKGLDVESRLDANDVYQFPMGKVKAICTRLKRKRLTKYQFPMGKVKLIWFSKREFKPESINSQWER